jgi:predicted anti-sigma-YlaC factor YlaD
MSMPECAWARDRAEELALGVLDGAERAEVLRHVNACPTCQAVVHELAEVADVLAHLAPEAEPPPGFEQRVLRVIRGDRGRRLRRRVAVLAATAAAATIVAVGTVRIVDAGRDADRTEATPVLRTVPITGVDGQTVGRVAISRGAPAQLAVDVDYSVPTGTYALELRDARGDATTLGTLNVDGGHGEWMGPADLPREGPATLATVGADGQVVCSADLSSGR